MRNYACIFENKNNESKSTILSFIPFKLPWNYLRITLNFPNATQSYSTIDSVYQFHTLYPILRFKKTNRIASLDFF